MHGYKLQSLNEWKPMEINRSIELSSNSIYVNFHLDILSKVKGWKLINKTKHPSDAFARVLQMRIIRFTLKFVTIIILQRALPKPNSRIDLRESWEIQK